MTNYNTIGYFLLHKNKEGNYPGVGVVMQRTTWTTLHPLEINVENISVTYKKTRREMMNKN